MRVWVSSNRKLLGLTLELIQSRQTPGTGPAPEIVTTPLPSGEKPMTAV